MKVHRVYHRKDAIWQFSVVGRPPQEDSSFGWLIHELVKELTPQEFPGLVELHAVDVAGVHPLLLAIGQERYMPFRERKPEELLTIANRILGTGQTSLAKFLIIAAEGDVRNLDTHDMPTFFQHVLERVDWTRDLHFQTRTTIDTLDYSGSGWNEGSKVVIACCGPKQRELIAEVPSDLQLPEGFENPRIALPGVLAIKAPKFTDYATETPRIEALTTRLKQQNFPGGLPLVVLTEDPEFLAENMSNFLWVTFTRANPSHDVYGVDAFVQYKHWGCNGALVIDARIKGHHAPVLVPDARIKERVDRFFAPGGELHGRIKGL
jgi:4-hydroxy-3-polyprenylbenzoate decarboxylase